MTTPVRHGTRSGRSIAAGLHAVAQAGRDTARRALTAAALTFEAELKSTLSTPGRGAPRRAPKKVRRQLRSKRAGVRAKGLAFQAANRASRPGDPPAPDTGRLRNSITHEITDRGMKARVGTNLVYAEPLEYGSGKLAARPFMRPTAAKVEKVLRARGVLAALKRGS